MWLDAGRLRAIGRPQDVVRQYDSFLSAESSDHPDAARAPSTPGYARISRVVISVDGVAGHELQVRPHESTLRIVIEFESDPALPAPTAGITIDLPSKKALTCAVTRTDGQVLERDAQGRGRAAVEFPRLGLRKGQYHIGAYLANENAVHIFDSAVRLATLTVDDPMPEPGYVTLPHRWQCNPGHSDHVDAA
jgi:lipopolysaccharide transport system ATP-binding protein